MASLWKCFINKRTFFALLVSWSLVCSAKDFTKKKVTLSGKTFEVEIAETPAQLERGLMFRGHLAENEGMLFVFKDEGPRFFWMKNTLIDLSIGFFDSEGVLVDVQEMKSGKGIPDTALPSYPSARPAKFALEMNKGWFDKNKIKIGSKLKIH